MRARFVLALTLLCGAVLWAQWPSSASENFIPVPTELKISSASVSIRAPLGVQYRPGEAFPLEIHIDNPGSAIEAELSAVEGSASGEWAERAVLPANLSSGTWRVTLPLRAPGVSAAITLALRGAVNGGGRAELFRASLSPYLRPLPSGGRNVLVCGGGFAPRGPQIQASHLLPLELPAEDWMWESVDWVVVNDASIKEARPESREALRRWLLGGGRIFLGSREALAAAVSLHLLPIETPGEVSAEWNWWEKNADLKKDDVLAAKNFRPVYARARNGFGLLVFLFPGSDARDADGAAVFNRADIQRHHTVLPDARIQPERFGAFAQSAPGDARRLRAIQCAAFGALILCAALWYAHSSRSKLEAALLPFAVGAPLVALLFYWFPQQDLAVSRLTWERRSADGAAIVRGEWMLLEATRIPVERNARGRANGTLAPRFEDLDDLRAARLDRSVDGGVMALERIVSAPNQPAMLYASHTDSALVEKSNSVKTALNISGKDAGPRVPADSLNDVDATRAIWIRADGSVALLQKNASGDRYDPGDYSPRALEVALGKESSPALAKAHATALSWAVEDAVREGGEALILWNTAPHSDDPLITIDGKSNGAGNDFYVRTISLSQ